jgi:hypothetical protein
MDKFLSGEAGGKSSPPLIKDGWISSSDFLSLPCKCVKHASEAAALKLEIKGLHHHHLLDVIKVALMEPAAEKFHLFPFYPYWKPSPEEPEEWIYSEVYTRLLSGAV